MLRLRSAFCAIFLAAYVCSVSASVEQSSGSRTATSDEHTARGTCPNPVVSLETYMQSLESAPDHVQDSNHTDEDSSVNSEFANDELSESAPPPPPKPSAVYKNSSVAARVSADGGGADLSFSDDSSAVRIRIGGLTVDFSWSDASTMVKKHVEGGGPGVPPSPLLLSLSQLFEPSQNKTTAESLYQDGVGILFGQKQDLETAFELLNRSSALGNPHATFVSGVMYSAGLGTARNPSKALSQYYMAALKSSASANMALGYRYAVGLDVDPSCSVSGHYYINAARTALAELGKATDKPGTSPSDRTRLTYGDNGIKRSKQTEQLSDAIHYSERVAEQGNLRMQMTMGQVYRYGLHGVPVNHARAADFFRMAATHGDPWAMVHLGEQHEHGLGTTPSNESALSYYRDAAVKGLPTAIDRVGQMYLWGKGVEQNYSQALRHFELAVAYEDNDSLFNLGRMYYHGLGVDQNFRKAYTYVSKAARKGHRHSMYLTGKMVLEGKVPDEGDDDEEGGGSTSSTWGGFSRSILLWLGLGIGDAPPSEQNCPQAVQYLRRVADPGPWSHVFVDAHDSFVDGNLDVALVYYMIAAELGYEIAESNVAWMLQNDMGFHGNKTERESLALHYLERATRQGHAGAVNRLADCYYYGELGLTRNWTRAAELYETAATRGYVPSGVLAHIDLRDHMDAARRQALFRSQAWFSLAYMHQFGQGMPRDFALARRYYHLSERVYSNAYYPVRLALAVLRLHVLWAQWLVPLLSLAVAVITLRAPIDTYVVAMVGWAVITLVGVPLSRVCRRLSEIASIIVL